MALSKVGGNQIDSVSGDLTVDTNTLVVDATNNRVGVGTASPTQATLHVDGGSVPSRFESTSASTSYVQFGASGTSNYGQIAMTGDNMTLRTSYTDRMTILSGGNVGISEASPDTKLHLTDHSANAGPVIRLEGNSQNTAGNLLGGIECFNADASGDGPNVVSAIKFLAHSAIDHGGQITFSTHDGTEGGEGSAPVERARINQDGNLLLGTSSDIEAGARLQVKYTYTNPGAAWESNSTAVHNAIMFRNPNGAIGTIQTTGSSTQYNTSSDYRLKENVADMTGAIARVKALAPKRFNFIADDTVTVDGFLAHEAQAVVPEAVSGTKDEVDDDGNPVMQGIDQSKLVPLLTAALREAIAKIEVLEARVTALEGA